MSDSVWSSQVHARNAAIRAAREARDSARSMERENATVRETSDAEALLQDIHQVSAESKPENELKGVKASRALPDWAQRGINALPEGHELRKARDEGRLFYDVRDSKWKARGVAPAPEQAKSDGKHFLPGMFQNTARRQRERQAL